MTARVAIGNLGGGKFGLRASLPGIDVLTEGSGDGFDKLSFSTEWTNTTKILQTGVTSYPDNPNQQTPVTSGFYSTVPFTDPGYVPFVEARHYSGSVIYDDLNSIGSILGFPSSVWTTKIITYVIRGSAQFWSCAGAGTAFYVVYKIPSGAA